MRDDRAGPSEAAAVNAVERRLQEPVALELTVAECIVLHAAAKTLAELARDQDEPLKRGGDLQAAMAKLRERVPGIAS